MYAGGSYDVIVVGAGPTGLTLTNLLGGMGVSVLLAERNRDTVAEPRAVSIDDESMRTMQAAGVARQVTQVTARGYGSIYMGPDRKTFAQVMPHTREYGWDKRNAFEQPVLEQILRDGLGRFANVDLRFGCEVVDFSQSQSQVEVSMRADGADMTATARYLVACDGGRSGIRKSLDVTMEGATFEEPWLIVDLWQTANHCRHTEVVCDPAQPFITLPGPRGIRRYEFMMRPGDDKVAAVEEANVRALLRRVGPDGDMPLRRKQIYTFHARVADRWRVHRVFLAGDAAHLSPPFAGQGMNSGIRDAHNLAWKLHEVLRSGDKAAGSADILDSYQTERKPHVLQMIRLALNMGKVMMPRSRVRGALTRLGFRSLGLWPPAKAYVAQMRYKPKPRFAAGLIWPVAGDLSSELVGQLIPQPMLEAPGGERTLMDDLLPDRTAVLVFDEDPSAALEPAVLNELREAGAAVFGIVPEGLNARPAELETYRDASGLFSNGPSAHCIGHAILLRRDRYVCAVAPIAHAADLVDHVRQLRPRPRGTHGAAPEANSLRSAH